MNNTLIVILSLAVAVNPAVLGWSGHPSSTKSKRQYFIICTLSSCGLFALGSLAGLIFNILEISTPTFRLGAALVIGLNSGRWLLVPKSRHISGKLDVDPAHVFLHLFGPAPVFATVAGGGDVGILPLLLACVISLALMGLVTMTPTAMEKARSAIIRFFGGSGILIAVIMGIDAARTV